MKVISYKHLNRIREGDMEPLQLIFDSNYTYCIQNLIKLFNCDESDAKDVTMDAILVLQEKITSNEYKNQNVRSFLLTVATNKLRNKRKRDKRIETIDPTGTWIFREPMIDSGASDYYEKKANEVIAVIHSLKDPCKSILKMILLQGYSLDAALEKMPYESKGVLKTTKSRCIDKIRQVVDFK